MNKPEFFYDFNFFNKFLTFAGGLIILSHLKTTRKQKTQQFSEGRKKDATGSYFDGQEIRSVLRSLFYRHLCGMFPNE